MARKTSRETILAVRYLYDQHRSWLKVGRLLNANETTLHQIAHEVPGVLSVENENLLRQKLGMRPLALLAEACPTCGDTVHTHDCSTHTLKPKAPSKSKKRKGYYRPCLSPDLKGQVSTKEITDLINIYIENKDSG